MPDRFIRRDVSVMRIEIFVFRFFLPFLARDLWSIIRSRIYELYCVSLALLISPFLSSPATEVFIAKALKPFYALLYFMYLSCKIFIRSINLGCLIKKYCWMKKGGKKERYNEVIATKRGTLSYIFRRNLVFSVILFSMRQRKHKRLQRYRINSVTMIIKLFMNVAEILAHSLLHY